MPMHIDLRGNRPFEKKLANVQIPKKTQRGWDADSKEFVKVIFEGFEMLSFFTVYEGYIENFIRGSSPETSFVERLVWKGNTLIKE